MVGTAMHIEQHRSYCIEMSIIVSERKNKYALFWQF